MTDSCLGDLDWNCSGPITMEKKKKKSKFIFPPHGNRAIISSVLWLSRQVQIWAAAVWWRQSVQMAVRIEEKNRSWLWLKADSLMWTVGAWERKRCALSYPRWKLPLCIFIFILSRKAIRAMLCTCCQACKGLLNCLFDSFESAYSGQELQFRLI